MIRSTSKFRAWASATLLAPLVLTAAPVAVDDSYSVNEDASLGTAGAAILSSQFEPGSNVVTGTWQYLDKIKNSQNGQTADTYPLDGAGRQWTALNFDTATSTVAPWGSGSMPLQGGGIGGFPGAPNILTGYGGGNGGADYSISTYLFRRTFTLNASTAAVTQWTLRHLVDDAAIFYVNGQEVFRTNLAAGQYTPAGAITTNTVANASLPDENTYTTSAVTIPTGVLTVGDNILAIEVHQGGGTNSSDVGIDCQLTPGGSTAGGFSYLDDPFGTNNGGNASGSVDASGGNPGGALLVDLGRANSTNYSGGWRQTFTLGSPATVRFTFDWKVGTRGGLESDEYCGAVMMLNGVRYGPTGTAPALFLGRVFGIDNNNPDLNSAWTNYTVDLPLSAGTHTLTLGGFCNKTTTTGEYGLVWFDNVNVASISGGNGLLANDTGGAVTAQLVGSVAHGALTLAADGNFSYVPDANYFGTDSFTYQAVDAASAVSNTATVTLTVNPVNDLPVAVTDSYSTNQQQTLTVNAASGVLANDSDIDDSAAQLTADVVTNPIPAQGTLTLSPNGAFVFNPAAGFVGPASFAYRVSDGTGFSSAATVNINVISLGNAPVAVSDSYTTAVNAPLTVTALVPSTITDDVIPFGSSVVPSLWKYLDDGTDQGVLWRAPNFDDSTWKTGGAELGYGNGDEVTVVEDNPVAGYTTGVNDRYATTYFRRVFTIDRLYEVTAAQGSLVFDDGVVVYLGGLETFRTTTMSGAGIDPAFDYFCPSSGNNDTTNFTLATSGLAEGLNYIAAEVHQTQPTSSDISFNLRLRLTRQVPAGLLANDTDLDPGTTLIIATNTQPSHGTLTLNANGTFTYTPAVGYIGPDSFTYTCTDGLLNSSTATVTLTVVPGPNVRPVAQPNSYTATEDTTLTVNAATGVLANDSDADGDAMSAVLAAAPSSGSLTLNADGSFSYTPAANFAGAVSFTYTANDAGGASFPATVTINVSNVNDAPVSVADAYATDPGVALSVPVPGVLANDSDADAGATLTAQLVTGPVQGTLTLLANGSFNYAPPPAFTGLVSFVYRASDGVAVSANATVTIRINGRPVSNSNAYSATEDTPLTISAPGVLGNDTDPENDALTAQLTAGVAHGTLSLAPNGGFSYTPAANFNGTDSFTYKAFDGTRDSVAPATVTINVTAVNDAPVSAADSYATALDTPLTVPVATGVLSNDSDVDGQSITAEIAAAPANGFVSLNPDGSFSYTPNSGYSGVDTFSYRASDGVLFSAIAVVSVNVGIDLDKIVINEIHYHPQSLSASDEFIEIYNGNPGAIDVGGWQLTSGVNYVIPAGTAIAGGGFLVIAANPLQFTATFGSVSVLRGPWTGELSNSGEVIRLKSAAGETVDELEYADEGDWAERRQVAMGSETSWEWYTRSDALGSSLELVNPALTNKNGQNWAASVASPTPGNTNSRASANIAPLISNLDHRPQIPRSTDPVQITVEVKDEALTPPSVSLFWRVSTASPGAFTQELMADDGLHGDGAAADGNYGATVPPQANGSVVEFYVSATDAVSTTRTWPAAGRDLAGSSYIQAANAFYQVDEEVWGNHYPIYRLVGPAADVARYLSTWDRNSDAQVNVTLVSKQGTDFDVRYRCGLRVRGAGSRGNSVNNWRLNIPKDDKWRGETEANLNVWHTHLGDLGSKMMECAGLIHERSWPVQLRLNATNRALANSAYSGGYFIHLQPAGSEYLREVRPNDNQGNIYKKIRPHQNYRVRELSAGGPPNPAGYVADGWIKGTNDDLNDWNDLHNLMKTFSAGTPTVAQMEAVIDAEYWLRWFAFQTIINHNETNLSNGANDDYGLYRGVLDPRFIPLAHDFDTVWGGGGNTSSADPTSPTATIYQLNGNFSSSETIPALAPLFTNPVMNQRFKAQLVNLLTTVFNPSSFDPMVDSILGDWTGPTADYGVSTAKRNAIKSFNAQRRTHILQTVLGYSAQNQPPAALTVTSSLAVQSGYPRTTTANVTGLSGTVDSTRVQKVRINGTDILPDNYYDAGNGASGDGEGGNGPTPWSAGSAVVLKPGINRLTIQALGPNDSVLSSQQLELWYDNSAGQTKSGTLAASEVWSADSGPYTVSANLTVPSGMTLTIEPGTSVFVGAGVTIQATGTGRILAEGTPAARIRFSAAPGAAGWGALDIINTTVESRFTYCDFENVAGTTVGSHTAKSHVNNAIVLFDNTVWGAAPAVQYISFDNSSFVVSNSVFPTYAGTFNTTSAPEMIHGVNGIPATGYGIFRDNYIGHTWGFNDSIDFTGGNRPGAILQVINNIFDGATDDCLDLDSTDAWIEGNVFMHVHQDTQRPNALDTASAISGGQDNAGVSEWTIINNLFFDVDHVVLAKNKNRFIFVNNTVSHVAREGGSGVDIAAFNFSDDSVALSPLADGQGGYVAGNIIHDCANLVPAALTAYNPANVTLQMVQNLFPQGVTWSGAGSGNVSANALLNTSLLPAPGVPTAGTVAQGLAKAASIRAALVPGQLSPALCTGLLGKNKGAYHNPGIEISGVPAVPVSASSLTLSVGPGGSFSPGTAAAYNWGYVSYRYSLDGGAYSSETPISVPLTLTGLAAGTHSVSVLGKTDAGVWQTVPTVSPVWTVSAQAQPVVINEVLAQNVSAWPVGSLRPDYIELRNTGTAAVNLSGWALSDSAITLTSPPKYVIPGGTTLAAGGLLVIGSQTSGISLDSDGDGVFLYSGAAVGSPLIDSVSFGFQIADKSISRHCEDLHWALGDATPALANVLAETTSSSGLRINEWLGTNDFIVQGDFVELYNPFALPVDLSGLILTDDAINFPAQHVIAPLSYIGAGGFVRFLADSNPVAGANHLSFSVSKLREGMTLLSGSTVIDHVMSAPQLQDVSQGRTTDGSSSISMFTLPTPGYSNATNLAAQQLLMDNVRITEVMYNPAGGNSAPEYIEIRSISETQTVDLQGIKFVNGITFEFIKLDAFGAPLPILLGPGAFTVITSLSQSAFNAVYPAAPYGGTYSGRLDNGGERVRMEIGGYQLGILDFSYADSWYPQTDGGGAALEIVNAQAPRLSWNEKPSWRATAPNPGFNGVFAVLAGEDQTICLPESAALEAVITYGAQSPAGVTLQWSKVSGPGTVNFSAPNSEVTNVSFSALGTYVLRFAATGTVTVTDDLVIQASESYDAWAVRTLNSADPLITGMLRDPDKDGLTNLLEFALGLNPADGKTLGLPVASTSGGTLSITYQRYTGCGLTYIVEVSTDLVSWSSTTVSESMTSSAGTLQNWTAVDSAPVSSSERRYMRVRVVAQ